MARNIEIKAQVDNMTALASATQALTGPAAAVLNQRDTYFGCANGRLKLREIHSVADGARSAELIFYRRPDTEEPALSDYQRIDVTAPAELRALLAAAHGERLVVEKQRTLHWHEATRIHLDRVKGLGDFMELEVTLTDEQSAVDGEHSARALMSALEISPGALEARGYADLLAEQLAR